jgi:DNA-binding NtrC family response regulator
MASILVCDDQRSICEMLDISLRKDGHRVETVNGGEAAKKKLSSANYELLITDIKMPQTDGIEVLRFARQSSPETSVILITAVEDYEAAVQAVKGGAFDYIHKGPGLLEELKLSVGRALDTLGLQRENFALKRDAATRNSLDNIIGGSPALEKLKNTIRTVAPTVSTVLIYGESGTGKELVARAVHSCSPRAAEPFVSINCGAFPETLLESELFGIEKGVATGVDSRVGQFQKADGGTLFLDEIGDLSLTAQAKILRVLQERILERVGGRTSIPVDVRILAATNKDLEAEILKGNFREDLFYRIKVIHIYMPPLREIREEIPLLANHFLKEYCKETAHAAMEFSPEVLRKLVDSPWPGNVRQLRNEVMRLAACSPHSVIGEEDLWEGMPTQFRDTPQGPSVKLQSLKNAVEEMERSMIAEALHQTKSNQQKAAKVLGLSRQGLINKMKRYAIAG